MMKLLRYLVALWIAVIVYSVLSLYYGAMGFSAYSQLLSGREIQWENMKKLGLINTELENTQNSLRFDADTVSVYARRLGYVQDDEQIVRIVGLGGMKNPYNTAGEVVTTPVPDFIPDKTIKITALLSALFVLATFFVFDLMNLKPKPRRI